MTKPGWTLFPTAEQDPSLRRSGLPVAAEKRREAEARREATSRHRTERARAKALKAAQTVPAAELRPVDQAELREALRAYTPILEGMHEQERGDLRELLHRTLAGDAGAASALRKIVMAHAQREREVSRNPPAWWWGRSRSGWGSSSW